MKIEIKITAKSGEGKSLIAQNLIEHLKQFGKVTETKRAYENWKLSGDKIETYFLNLEGVKISLEHVGICHGAAVKK